MRLPHRLLCLSAVSFTGWRLHQQQHQQQKHWQVLQQDSWMASPSYRKCSLR
jgi:hypothetical protein